MRFIISVLAACWLWASPASAADFNLPDEVDDVLTVAGDWAQMLTTDAVSIARQPADWQRRGWVRLGAVALGGVLLYQYDASLNKRFDHPNNRLLRLGANLGNPLGNLKLLLPALGLTAYIAQHHGQDGIVGTAGYAAEAAVLATITALGGKLALGRQRPGSGQGPHHFDGPGLHGDHNRSLPSGHSAAAFAVASVVATRHPVVAPVAYGAASLTAYARLARGRHWASDVFVGSALGLWIGHSVANIHSDTGTHSIRPNLALAPLNDGLTLTLNWTR